MGFLPPASAPFAPLGGASAPPPVSLCSVAQTAAKMSGGFSNHQRVGFLAAVGSARKTQGKVTGVEKVARLPRPHPSAPPSLGAQRHGGNGRRVAAGARPRWGAGVLQGAVSCGLARVGSSSRFLSLTARPGNLALRTFSTGANSGLSGATGSLVASAVFELKRLMSRHSVLTKDSWRARAGRHQSTVRRSPLLRAAACWLLCCPCESSCESAAQDCPRPPPPPRL